MTCKVSFIGLGVMGYPMAGYISKAGHNVTVYNRTKSKAEKWIKEYKGQLAETPMEAAWRDSRIGRIYEGTNEINRMLSVGMFLKKGMKGELDLMGAVLKCKKEINNYGNFDEKEIFGEEKQVLKNLKKVFLLLFLLNQLYFHLK